jgi:hypothetical protein
MFAKVFDSVTASLSRFVLGWAIPSAVTAGMFAVFVFPEVQNDWPFSAVGRAASNPVLLVGVLGLVVVTLSVLFAYMQVPIYRFLEGYTLPRGLRKRLYRGELRRWLILDRLKSHPALDHTMKQLRIENRLLYPEDLRDLQATRLGNALRAMETYGSIRFGLDSQTLWYELNACAPDETRRYVEQTRASVDLFISSVAHFSLLAAVSLGIGFWTLSWKVMAVGAVALLVVRPAYEAAVRNVLDFRAAVQALVHTARSPLAKQLGFDLPRSAYQEWILWSNLRNYVEAGTSELWSSLDEFRSSSASDESNLSSKLS